MLDYLWESERKKITLDIKLIIWGPHKIFWGPHFGSRPQVWEPLLYGLEGCVCYTALKIAYTVKPALKQHNCGAHAALSALSSWVFVRARSGRWEVTNEPSMPPFTSHAIKMFMQHIGHSFSITPKRSDCHLSLIPAAVMAVARSALQFLSQTAVIMATGFVRWA